MCVIIYKPAKQQITEEELRDAWTTNPDGAGLAYIQDGRVHYKRGYMYFKQYWAEVQKHQHAELLLHLRISTGAGVNKINTHPYKVGNVKRLRGVTTLPVICMNGIINGQPLHTKRGVKLNDTASYIIDHEDAFRVINEDVLDIIEDATDCRWAAATVDGVKLSKGFIKDDGLYYSNLNHKHWAWIYQELYDDVYDYSGSAYNNNSSGANIDLAAYIDSKKLLHRIQAEPETAADLKEYISTHCLDWGCDTCHDCIYNARTIYDIYNIIDGWTITRRY